MAVDDIIVDVFSIATGATTTFQPASGVEIMITMIGHTSLSGASKITVVITDGTLGMNIYVNDATNVNPFTPIILKAGITNGHFLSIINSDSGTEKMGFTGIQTK